MKKVFLDTNILIDTLEERRFSESSKAVVCKGKEGNFVMYVSLLSFVNIAYIRRKHSVDEIYNDLTYLRGLFSVVPIDAEQLDTALSMRMKDFEDNIQFQCAKAAGCDVFVTNNTGDFVGLQGIDIMTSEDFLLELCAEELE